MRTLAMNRSGRSGRRILLVQPPYAVFTYPYHSLAYVSAALQRGGYAVVVVDLILVQTLPVRAIGG